MMKPPQTRTNIKLALHVRSAPVYTRKGRWTMQQPCSLALILVVLIPMVDMQNNICSLRPDRGICPFTNFRWYYNVWTRSCQPFFYGGCFGNANNFQTRQECFNRCLYFNYFG